jgi:putative transposase
MDGLQFFDRKQDFTVAWKRLPHWSQAGTVCFITWRTADSLPKAVQDQLTAARREAFQHFGIQCESAPVMSVLGENGSRGQFSPRIAKQIAKLSPGDQVRLNWQLYELWDGQLDRGAGACVLARPELSEIVAASLKHFDSDRYVLTDFVVMPNHVHVLTAFADDDALLATSASGKRFTALEINRLLSRRGMFWQVEQFDHLVRSLEQFEHLRKYIAENPKKARLKPGSYRWYSKAL